MDKRIKIGLAGLGVAAALAVGAVVLSATPTAGAVSVTVPGSTWTVGRTSINWVPNGADGGAQFDVAVYVQYTDASGVTRGTETILIKGDGSAVKNYKGVTVLSPVPAGLVTGLSNLGTAVDNLVTNLAAAGKLNPR
jgi:hypothetical protein